MCPVPFLGRPSNSIAQGDKRVPGIVVFRRVSRLCCASPTTCTTVSLTPRPPVPYTHRPSSNIPLTPRLVGLAHDTGAAAAFATRFAGDTRTCGGSDGFSLSRPLVAEQRSRSLHAVVSQSGGRSISCVGTERKRPAAMAGGLRHRGLLSARREIAAYGSFGTRRSLWTPNG